ncbi:murein transglycosylase domain-containing protein [Dasania marina]|uniref:transglycosylase SLT domain-containing protein n=1 Tax=Dasania marina TaxID=471499 RepID=UPI0030D6E72D
MAKQNFIPGSVIALALAAKLVMLSPLLLAQDGAFNELETEVYEDFLPEPKDGSTASSTSSSTAKSKTTALSEYDAWKLQQAEEYKDYKRKYFAALEQYKASITEHWQNAEVTDKTSWVEYSEDLQTKRVVDFEKNEIRISILNSATSNKKIQQLIESNLAKILQQTPNSARQQDVVLKAVGSVTPAADAQSQLAILAELYQQKNVINKTVHAMAVAKSLASLKQRAVIKRPQPLKSNAKQLDKPEPVVITIALPKNSIGRRAARYQTLVSKNAKDNKLDPSLVYAIMHTESAFNPMARSHIPAYGLMQIVPESAGRDVARRLLGKDKVFSAEYLFNADNNVQAGATYINILYYSYLKGVEDPLSRLYCVIAAYNTGAGNVAKTFVGQRKLRKALPIINAMTPQQVYDTLVTKLPYNETREYLKRVVDRQSMYRKG